MAAIDLSDINQNSAIAKKTARLNQYGYSAEPEQNFIEKFLNLQPNKSVLENVFVDLLPRSEAASASLLGGLNENVGIGESLNRAKEAIQGKRKYSYHNMLGELGVEGLVQDIAGFGLGTALDPMTYIPVGKILGKVADPIVDIGRKIPVVKDAIGLTDDAIKGIKGALGRPVYANAADEEIGTLLRGGASGRTNFELKKVIEKYKPLLESTAKLTDDESKLVGRTVEATEKYLSGLSPEGKSVYGLLTQMFEETGTQKKVMGSVKNLIGKDISVKEATATIMDAIKSGDTDAARNLYKTFSTQTELPAFKKFIEGNVRLDGKVAGLKGGWAIAEADEYLPHMVTDEFRKYAKQIGKTPEEMIELMKGMGKRNIAKLEKSRTLLGRVAEYNVQSRKLYGGIDMFETDIKKILPKYLYNYSKTVGLMDLSKQLLNVTDDAGEAIIKPLGKLKEAPTGMVKLTGLPFQDGFFTKPEVARKINAVNGILTSDVELNKFVKAFDKGMNVWKKMVTAYSPTFTPNNFMGGSLNMFTDDVGSFSPKVLNHVQKMIGKKSTEIVPKVGKILTGEQMVEAAQKSGALVGQVSAEDGFKKGVVAGIDKAVGKYGFGAEKIMRLQTMTNEYIKTGNLTKAVKKVWEVHGNYNPESMATFERNVLKRGIPFINWAKTNIPFQVSSLINKTGKYSMMARAQNIAVSPEERAQLPEYMRNQILLPGTTGPDGKKSYRSLSLPVADLNKVDLLHPVQSVKDIFFNQMNPFIKAPLEMVFNKNLFFDQPIVDKGLPPSMQKAPAPELLARLADKIPAIGKAIGYQQSERKSDVTGDIKTNKEMNAYLAYLLNQLAGPVTKYANIPKSMDKEVSSGNTNSIMAALAGIFSVAKPNVFDPREQAVSNQKQKEAELQARINYLIQRGLIPKLK